MTRSGQSGLSGLASRMDCLAPVGDAIVRITAGALLIPHGAQKLFGWFGGHGLEGTGQFFASQLGMEPGLLFALLAGMIEVFGGLLLVLGLFTRVTAIIVTVFMAVAMSVHIPMGFFWGAGGIEYPLMWMLVAFAVFLRGGDRFSLDARFGLRY